MDTDMAAGQDAPKANPAEVAVLAVDAVAAGAYEVLADDVSRAVQAGLAKGVSRDLPAVRIERVCRPALSFGRRAIPLPTSARRSRVSGASASRDVASG